MTLRVKLPWRILSIAFVVGIIGMLVDKFSSDEFHMKDWILLVFWPLIALVFFFIIPSLHVIFSEKGISANWKVGFRAIVLLEQKNFHFRWQDVLHVYNLNPKWFPLHMIGIIGQRNGKQHMFFIGSLMTHKKEALLYIADHVGRGIIDQEVRKMIEKYRRQLQD